jgi:hypothetical protein
MQYVMLVRVDPELAATTTVDDVEPWVEEGASRGLRIEGRPLEDPATATTVRVRDGAVLLSDGPFAETKEIVAGYDRLEAQDLETALDYVGRHPVAAIGALEVREVWDGFVDDLDAEAPPTRADGIDYLFLHTPDPGLLRTATRATGDPTPWVRSVEEQGATLGGDRLRDADDRTAATVRRRDGELLISRGPFAEVAEQIAGIDLIRAADLDEAIAIAAAHPTARIGAIEVRPFQRT